MSRDHRITKAPLLIKSRQVATLLAITRPTVYKLIRTGHLKGVRVGKSWRVAVTDALRLAQEGTGN